MLISEAAKLSGLPAKTIRYYHDIKLVSPNGVAVNGYRDYGKIELSKLVFIRKAREFGFSIEECRELLSLYEDTNRASSDVKRIATERINLIDRKLHELQSLRDELGHLVEACSGDERPDCPILDQLSGYND